MKPFCNPDSWPVYSFNDNFVRRLYHLHIGKHDVTEFSPSFSLRKKGKYPSKVEHLTLRAVSRKRGISLFSFFSFCGKKKTKKTLYLWCSFWTFYISLNMSIFCSCCYFYRTLVRSLPCFVLHQSSWWDLIDVTLVCEDANSKLVGVVTVANDDAEKLLATVWCRFGCWSLVINSNFCSDFEHKGLVEILS